MAFILWQTIRHNLSSPKVNKGMRIAYNTESIASINLNIVENI
jgi:hypothetical protein